MVQNLLLTKEPSLTELMEKDGKKNFDESAAKKKMFENVFNNERKIVSSKSFNCLADKSNKEEESAKNNNNDSVNNILSEARKSKSLSELYYLKTTIDKCTIEIGLTKHKAVSTGKIDKCVRFNDEITITELNDEYDRRPMPLAKMYYKDQVELSQLREEMRQIQYRIINKIEGKLLLG
eukprot:jgi/Orpsp1_1/1182173/evm.model.c7180000080175.1